MDVKGLLAGVKQQCAGSPQRADSASAALPTQLLWDSCSQRSAEGSNHTCSKMRLCSSPLFCHPICKTCVLWGKKTNSKQAVLSSRASQVQVLHPQKVPHECLRNRVGQAQLANRTTHTVHTAVARAALCWVTSARPSGSTANSVFTRVVGLFLFSFLLYLCESYGSFVPLFIWNLEKMLREHWDCSLCFYFWGCFHPLAWSAFHCCKSQKCEGRCLDTLPLKNDRMLLFLLFTLRLNLTGLTRSAMEDTSASIMRKRKQDRWVSCLLELPAPLSLVEACRAPLKNDDFFKLLLLAENKHPRILSWEYDDEDPIIRARFVLGYFTNAHKFFCF